MARIISGALKNGVALTAASDNPVTVAAGASIATSDPIGLNGAAGTAWELTNLGLVKATTTAIKVAGTGTVHNGDAAHASALAEASMQGILIVGTGSVTNDGTVKATGPGSIAVRVQAGGVVENRATGTISGIYYGVNIEGASGKVENLGTITATEQSGGAGVELDNGGTVINGAADNFTASIVGGNAAGVYIIGGTKDRVQNFGTIEGLGDAGTGVALWSGGTIENAASASITALHNGIGVVGGTGSVVNAGTIIGSGSKGYQSFGAYLGAGGSVANDASGMIVGGSQGVWVEAAEGTVANSGLIRGVGSIGIQMDKGGTVTNAATGVIRGATRAINFSGSEVARVVNDGVITGDVGIAMPGDGATLINGGTITGTGGTAVGGSFRNDLIVVKPGATFNGKVDLNGSLPLTMRGVDTLELAPGAGSLGGFGSTLSGFSTIRFDPGAAWTLSGALSGFTAGPLIIGFNANDALSVAGTGLALSDVSFDAAAGVTSARLGGAQLTFAGQYDAKAFATTPDGPSATRMTYAGTPVGSFVGEGGQGATRTYSFTVDVPRNTTEINNVGISWQVTTPGGTNAAGPDDFAGGVLPQGSFRLGQGSGYSATIEVVVNGDSVPEADEIFTVTYGGTDLGTFIIRDDDASPAPTAYAVAPQSQSVNEGAGTASFTLTRTGAMPAETVFVSTTATEGDTNSGDYVGLAAQSFAFTAGQATLPISVPILNDAIVESAETLGLIVQRNANDANTVFLAKATATILDDDDPAFDNVVMSAPADETFDLGAGNDTVVFSQARDQYLVGILDAVIRVDGPDGRDELRNVEHLKFGEFAAITVESLRGQPTTDELYQNLDAGTLNFGLPTHYVGPNPLDYILPATNGSDVLQGTSRNDFANLGAGNDAANMGAGDDVVDGGGGSNFLTGGVGRDTFFIDGRDGVPVWSCITDWQPGEALTLWGWQDGVSVATWSDSDGLPGYLGATMYADIDGNGLIETAITWTGMAKAGLPTGQAFDVGGIGVLYFN
jgi:hypothetical protein